ASASAPLLASPTTSMSGALARSTENPLRTRTWSSATSTRIVISRSEGRSGHTRFARSRRLLEREQGPNPVAAADRRTGRQLAAPQLHALAHAEQAVAGAVEPGPDHRRRQPAAVVAHLDGQPARLVVEAHLDGVDGSRVLQHVGERLLDDPVGR